MTTRWRSLLYRLDLHWSRGSLRWVAGATVALVYAVFYLVQLFRESSLGTTRLTVAVTMSLLACAAYMALPGAALWSLTRTRWAVFLVIGALFASQLLIVGSDGVSMLLFVGVVAGFLLPSGQAVLIAVVIAAAIVGLTWGSGDSSWELAVTEIAVTLWMMGFTQNIRNTAELRLAREQLAVAAVEAERQRIAADLHDILGHSLTAVSVKASLARTVVLQDPARARNELDDIEQLARSALKDVRATASGMRTLGLASELAVARSVLTAAGITPDLPTAVDDVSPRGREVFGFVLREAVTNVVRHSRASRCTVTLGANRIDIVDDGVGPSSRSETDGSGLAGLARRLHEVGGTVTAGRTEQGGFRVTAELTSPRSPRAEADAAASAVPGGAG